MRIAQTTDGINYDSEKLRVRLTGFDLFGKLPFGRSPISLDSLEIEERIAVIDFLEKRGKIGLINGLLLCLEIVLRHQKGPGRKSQQPEPEQP